MKLTEDCINKILSLISINPNLIDKEELSKYELSLDQIDILKDNLDWSIISKRYNPNWDFYEKFSNLIDWFSVSSCGSLPVSFIEKYKNKLYLEVIFQNQSVPEEYLENIVLSGNYNQIISICSHQYLSEDFMRKHQGLLSWDAISAHQILCQDFVDEFLYRINLKNLKCQNLSEDFISDNIRYLNIKSLVFDRKFSEEFLENNIKYFDVLDVVCSQSLSEEFILKHGLVYRVPYAVLKNQNITSKLILEFEQALDNPWDAISYYSNLTFDIVKNNIEKLHIPNILKNKTISKEIKNYIAMFA